MKKLYNYSFINNSLGWLCFLIAAVTYLLTLEPTASFWDCPEFIAQGAKLEVGHPPGNPIFMLTARFFINFTGGNLEYAALAVNTMSALLSAGTILLLFWSITHLAKVLIVGRGVGAVTLPQLVAIMGSGLCGALVYTWSDTFWFSAVEGEVYAFSSFCTALVFWLILKWENRADKPHSDRYLILIAYVIGVSIAVHLLNLLCIPAIALVVYYRKWARPTLSGSIVTIIIAAALIALILYGLVPGFIGVAGEFEVFCVNSLGMSYNVGVLIYALILIGVMIWCIYSLYKQKSPAQIRWSFLLTVVLSGMPFIGSGIIIPLIIIAALAIYLFAAKKLPVRILTIAATSIMVIFIGYSSYALLLIRSNANPPMNQNAPDNVFDLASYLSREQYGDTPLLYGQAFTSERKYVQKEGKNPESKISYGASTYQKDPANDNHYIKKEGQAKPEYVGNMLFPRMHSANHTGDYLKWLGLDSIQQLGNKKTDYVVYDTKGDVKKNYIVYDRYGKPYLDQNGRPYMASSKRTIYMPSFKENLDFFLNYQFNHMYWRYFMWNFAGRQNDMQNQFGELNRGNWISGIPFIDNARLGDQSLLPAEQGRDNPGHNVFYMLPLLMGLFGLIWQAFAGERGIEQFWVVFMLFFMTGIAIVLYLNQTPTQPRERDYAFAGSFYAFAIWVGLGVGAIWRLVMTIYKKAGNVDKESSSWRSVPFFTAVAAAIIGLVVPAQMVSQTWDDHDRSGRYTARDYGMNYLSSLDENAIIFTNGDNDTFPLWYAQEVEGYRTDVRVVNLSYLTTPWYANQLRIPSYEAAAIDMQATPEDYALDSLQIRNFPADPSINLASDVLDYAYKNRKETELLSNYVAIPSSIEGAIDNGVLRNGDEEYVEDYMVTDIFTNPKFPAILQNGLLALDIINTSASNGWNRPVYFAMTVPDEYYLGLNSYLRNTGLAYQVTPASDSEYDEYTKNISVNTEKMYKNVTENFRWGGLDKISDGKTVYLDETVRRMVSTHRMSLYDLAAALYNEGLDASYTEGEDDKAAECYRKSLEILNLMDEKLPVELAPYSIQMGERIGSLYYAVGRELGDAEAMEKGRKIIANDIKRFAEYLPYFKSLIERDGGSLIPVYWVVMYDRNRRPYISPIFDASLIEDNEVYAAPVYVKELGSGKIMSITDESVLLSEIDKYVPEQLARLLEAYEKCGGDAGEFNIAGDIIATAGYMPISLYRVIEGLTDTDNQ